MPQFDFAHVFWPQVSWLAVCFVVLYFGIVGLTLPRLSKVMDQREGRIAGDIDAARAAKLAADETETRYAADLERARDKARAEIEHAKQHAVRASTSRLEVAHEATDQMISSAEGRIAKAVATAEESLRQVISEVTQAVVTRVTGTEPSLDTVSAAVDARELA